MSKLDVKQIFGAFLEELMDAGQPVMVVDPDMRRLSYVGNVAKKYPANCLQVGIAEQNAVGVAAGLASMGNTVFVTTFAGFLASRASDQALNSVCYNDLDVKLCGTYAGLSSGVNGGTHISVEDMAVFRSMPTMRVADPVDGVELAAVLKTAAATRGPVFIRIPKGPLPTLLGADTKFEWGKGIVLHNEGDITLISSGIATYEGASAVAALAEEGIRIRHIHMPSIKPLDVKLVIDAAKKSRIIFTAENHSILGGLGSAVCEVTSAFAPIRVVQFGINDTFCEGMSEQELMQRHGLAKEPLIAGIKKEIPVYA